MVPQPRPSYFCKLWQQVANLQHSRYWSCLFPDIMSTGDILWSPLFDVLDEYTRDEDAKALFEVSREQYLAERAAQTFGTANPSLMEKPFWKYMIAFGGAASNVRETFDPPENAWDYWKPVWCFSREGQTETKLRDGRVVCSGGKHEVFDDPDSCIYNDMFILDNEACINTDSSSRQMW